MTVRPDKETQPASQRPPFVVMAMTAAVDEAGDRAGPILVPRRYRFITRLRRSPADHLCRRILSSRVPTRSR